MVTSRVFWAVDTLGLSSSSGLAMQQGSLHRHTLFQATVREQELTCEADFFATPLFPVGGVGGVVFLSFLFFFFLKVAFVAHLQCLLSLKDLLFFVYGPL